MPTFDAIVEIVGPDRVVDDPSVIARYARSDTTRAAAPVAVVRPRSRAELAAIVAAANASGISVYPISRGENWGYGAGSPVCAGQLLLDLRDLRAIEVNAELAYAVIEPGVTQLDLARHLAQKHPNLVLDCTGAPGSTSIVGNVLERGVGYLPGGRAANVAGMEVITADGTELRLGFGAYGADPLAYCRKGTLGPDLEGLFLQSNFGIVSRLGMWLRPRPEVIKTYWIACDGRQDLLRLLTRFQKLWLTDGWVSVARGGRLTGRLWDLGGVVYGSRGYTDAFEEALRRACRGVAEVLFIVPTGDWEETASRELARVMTAFWLRSRVAAPALRGALSPATTLAALLAARRFRAGPLFQMLKRRVGVMSGTPVPEGGHIPLDRDDRQLGDTYRYAQLWLAPACPFTERDVDRCLSTIERAPPIDGVEVGIEWIVTDPRSLIVLTSLSFERGGPAEARALARYDELWDELSCAGYVSYRGGVQGMHKLRDGAGPFWDTVAELKRALDPKATIAPGRYSPDEARSGPFATRR